MMLAKMATPVFAKIKVFWNKGYDIIIFVHDATNKILSRGSNYRCGHVTKVWQLQHIYEKSYHNLNFIRIWPEKPLFFEG